MNGFFERLYRVAFDPNIIMKGGDFLSMLEGRWCLAYCGIFTYIMQSWLVLWVNG